MELQLDLRSELRQRLRPVRLLVRLPTLDNVGLVLQQQRLRQRRRLGGDVPQQRLSDHPPPPGAGANRGTTPPALTFLPSVTPGRIPSKARDRGRPARLP